MIYNSIKEFLGKIFQENLLYYFKYLSKQYCSLIFRH